MYSDIAIKVAAAKACGIIKSNAHFWESFSSMDQFEESISDDQRLYDAVDDILKEIESSESEMGIVCYFDENFPAINSGVKSNSDKPFLLYYKGDISLLSDLNRNVAVIGLINPDESIMQRGERVVKNLVNSNHNIVSGLAKGCDTLAHKVCLESGGKTIAILSTQVNKIYPAENRGLAAEIVDNGGLLISEYSNEPSGRNESIKRLIDRDRLQAMFSKAVVLIASYRKGEGDSGSRHAMDAAKKYGVERYVMYNPAIDNNNIMFGLNKYYVQPNSIEQAKTITENSISEISRTMIKGFLSRQDNYYVQHVFAGF